MPKLIRRQPFVVLELASDRERRVWRMLVKRWWPHPAHKVIFESVLPDGVLHFKCDCGKCLHIDPQAAASMGIAPPAP
jgi:hypothetical protein